MELTCASNSSLRSDEDGRRGAARRRVSYLLHMREPVGSVSPGGLCHFPEGVLSTDMCTVSVEIMNYAVKHGCTAAVLRNFAYVCFLMANFRVFNAGKDSVSFFRRSACEAQRGNINGS